MKAARFLRQIAGTAAPPKRDLVKAGETGIQSVFLNQTNKGIAQVSIAVKAGTRHEVNDNVAHSLAAMKNASSESHTEYLQTQQLDRAGAQFTADVSRDHIVYTLKCGPRLASEMFSDVVLPALFCSNNWEWELVEKEHYLTKANEQRSASDKQLDLLHSVSFRSGGLNRSVNPAGHRLGTGFFRRADHVDVSSFYWPIPQIYDTRVKIGEVIAHRDMTFTHDNITVFTSGLEELEAQAIVDSVAAYTAPGGARDAGVAVFVPGESRIPSGALPSGMLGFPGAAAGAANAGAYAILAQAIGAQSLQYEGAGLFALPFTCPKAALARLSDLSDNQLDAAREISESCHAIDSDSFDGAVGQMLTGSFGMSFSASNDEVRALAASLLKGPKSMVVEGQLGATPFLAEL